MTRRQRFNSPSTPVVWKHNAGWGSYKVLPKTWEVSYPGYTIKGQFKDYVVEGGVSRFSTRQEARNFVKRLQEKNRLPAVSPDKLIVNITPQD